MNFNISGKRGELLRKSPRKTEAIEKMLAVMNHIDCSALEACWKWPEGLTREGYGRIGQWGGDRKPFFVHRLSFEFHKGMIPYRSVVMHSCDTPACFNPKHLFLGSYSDNSQDMVRKGRQRKQANTPQIVEKKLPATERVSPAKLKKLMESVTALAQRKVMPGGPK